MLFPIFSAPTTKKSCISSAASANGASVCDNTGDHGEDDDNHHHYDYNP